MHASTDSSSHRQPEEDCDLPGSAWTAGLLSRYRNTRSCTEQICRNLETEDHVVQPAPFVSPPKWHLAHSTWFFDRFVLSGRQSGTHINLLFNSYYKSQGEHWLQSERGHLSRPTVAQVLDYRASVDEAVSTICKAGDLTGSLADIIELGIHHEQQHQELLLMDIKYILGKQPLMPAYELAAETAPAAQAASCWLDYPEGLETLGDSTESFAFDNERPAHRHWLDSFQLRTTLVRNSEFLQFIEDGGYERPELWLSDGWDWVQAMQVRAPEYWQRTGSGWQEYHLSGSAELNPDLPVCHVSYYEADAFARWAGARLPTEAELEVAARRAQGPTRNTGWAPGAAVVPVPGLARDDIENGLLWQWTRSSYDAYPGYVPTPGALGEYNGKFMSGQMVLRGGCIATPTGHYRDTYRNFYRPADRWCFTGIRLARNVK